MGFSVVVEKGDNSTDFLCRKAMNGKLIEVAMESCLDTLDLVASMEGF